MRRRYRALDLFCGAGGASVGLSRAGFDVVGVDVKFSKNYPFTMIVCDVRDVNSVINLGDFDLIWSSPPCQRFSKATPKRCRGSHPDLIEPTRELLAKSNRLTVIENVPAAPIRADIILDGIHFGLPLERRRTFEVNFPTDSLVVGPRTRPASCPTAGRHSGSGNGPSCLGQFGSIEGPDCGELTRPEFGLPKAFSVAGGGGADKGSLGDWKKAMGIDWMTRRELVEAVPPAYAECIGLCAAQELGKL